MAEQEHVSGGYWRGLVTGALIGAGVALLLAPKRGEELREEIAQNAAEWKSRAGSTTLAERAQELKDRASELSQNVAQKAQDLTQKAQDNVEEAAAEIAADEEDA